MEYKQHSLLQFEMHLNDSLLNITSHEYVYQENKWPFNDVQFLDNSVCSYKLRIATIQCYIWTYPNEQTHIYQAC